MTSDKSYGISISVQDVPRDGRGDASAGIQAALDSGAPLVYVPHGIYRIDKGLIISSHTRLEVHPETRLFFGDGAGNHAQDFLISNRNPERGDTDISISGGTWDGNNRNNPRGREGDSDAYTGTLLNMKNISGFEMRDVRLKDSTAYFTRFTRVRNFRIENVRFQITQVTRNQDGIHCAGHCENGEIHDLLATGASTTGDDMVALNADDALLRTELLGAEAGPIRNIRISNVRADDCHSFVRLASIWAEISDIDIRGVFGGCRCMAINADALRYCRVPLFSAKDPDYAHGVGMLRHIRFADAQVHKTSGSHPLFCLESRMDDLRLVNIRRNLDRDAQPATPLVVIKNVLQDALSAEYRIRKTPSSSDSLRRQKVAGMDDIVREEATNRISQYEIPDSSHLLNLYVGKPLIHALPPANNMVGLVT